MNVKQSENMKKCNAARRTAKFLNTVRDNAHFKLSAIHPIVCVYGCLFLDVENDIVGRLNKSTQINHTVQVLK